MKHDEHRMHENSLKTWEEIQASLGARERKICDVYRAAGREPLTDREVRNRCGFQDMNAVRPRITELIEAGILMECGNIPDTETGKTVRIVKLAPMQMSLPLSA